MRLPQRAAAVIGALPDFALAAAALITWVNPHLLGTHLVGWFVMLMLLEFIVVHSAAFLGNVAVSPESLRRRIIGTILVSLFYTLVVGGFALSFKSWWPVLAFWGLTANRMLGLIIGQAPSGKEKELIKAGWAAGALSYIVCVFPSVVLPLPRLGVRRDMMGELAGDSGGLWVEQPHRAIVFAALYFTAVGLSSLNGHRWLQERQRA